MMIKIALHRTMWNNYIICLCFTFVLLYGPLPYPFDSIVRESSYIAVCIFVDMYLNLHCYINYVNVFMTTN